MTNIFTEDKSKQIKIREILKTRPEVKGFSSNKDVIIDSYLNCLIYVFNYGQAELPVIIVISKNEKVPEEILEEITRRYGTFKSAYYSILNTETDINDIKLKSFDLV